MKYALGNMLNGAGGLNADQLSLDLQFATDKTLTARKGPTPAFTRASTATFVGSDGLIQSAAINAARFDHDPVTLACKGLLIEESRTNQILQSEDFSTSWSNDGGRIAVSTNVITSPSGAVNADKITENNILLDRRICIAAVTVVASTVYTYSCYLKAAERDVAQLAFGGIFGNQFQNFIIGGVNAGTLGSSSGVTSPQIVALAGGWYRCTATVTSAGSGSTQVTVGPSDSSTLGKWATYLGIVGSGIFVWGAQVEAGSFPTSYIPTTTASLARSADVCSITGSAFSGMYNQPEGTLFADVIPQVVAQVVSVLTVNTTTFNNSHTIFKGDNSFNNPGRRWGAQTFTGGIVATIPTSTDVATTRSRLAYAYKLNDMAFAASGLLIGTDTSGTMPSPTAMHIGMRDSSLQINGHLASVRYFRKRLSNAKLQTLTA